MGKRKMPGESCSIDITDTAPTTTGQAAEEVIDLAGDSPTTSGTVRFRASGLLSPVFTAGETAGQLEHPPTQIIDIDSAKSSPTSQEQRQKIMAHAALINSRKRLKAVGTPAFGPQLLSQDVGSTEAQQPQGTSAVNGSADSDAAKKAIMQHAARLTSNNSLLAQLHAERLARQQLANPQHKEDDPAKKHVHMQEPVSELSLLTYNVW